MFRPFKSRIAARVPEGVPVEAGTGRIVWVAAPEFDLMTRLKELKGCAETAEMAADDDHLAHGYLPRIWYID